MKPNIMIFLGFAVLNLQLIFTTTSTGSYFYPESHSGATHSRDECFRPIKSFVSRKVYGDEILKAVLGVGIFAEGDILEFGLSR